MKNCKYMIGDRVIVEVLSSDVIKACHGTVENVTYDYKANSWTYRVLFDGTTEARGWLKERRLVTEHVNHSKLSYIKLTDEERELINSELALDVDSPITAALQKLLNNHDTLLYICEQLDSLGADVLA